MVIFFFKQKTEYEMRISDWSSDVCSSDLSEPVRTRNLLFRIAHRVLGPEQVLERQPQPGEQLEQEQAAEIADDAIHRFTLLPRPSRSTSCKDRKSVV